MGYPLEIAWSVEIFVVAQICNMMLARKIRQMRISQMAPGKQISRGGGGCMSIESSKVPTCMESKGVTNGKTTRGGSTCKEWDFLRRKKIS
jgi:hypothetical protein